MKLLDKFKKKLTGIDREEQVRSLLEAKQVIRNRRDWEDALCHLRRLEAEQKYTVATLADTIAGELELERQRMEQIKATRAKWSA